MSSSLALCTDFTFLDEYVGMLRVKNVLGSMAHFVVDSKEVSWQVLMVAAKFKVLDKFLNKAAGADGKINRARKEAKPNVPPKQDSLKLRHKFFFALLQAYPSFDRGFIDLVLDNPDKLGHSSFLDTVQAEVS